MLNLSIMVTEYTAEIAPQQAGLANNTEFLYIDREKNFMSGRVACFGFVDGDPSICWPSHRSAFRAMEKQRKKP